VSWQDYAKCVGADPDLFFPDTAIHVGDVRRICATCPVRVQCLEFALEHNERDGIWGGTTPRERRAIRRHRRLAS
jgi:WhiB family redox-sensing transcriptional regulator